MKVLGLDTALGACSAAVWADGRLVARRFEPMGRGHAERLFALIGAVCGEADTALSRMDRFAVTIGPGSFTGTRVGVSAARGLGLAARRPVVGVTTFRAVAAAAAEEKRAENPIVVLFDARRGEVYAQMFDMSLQPLTGPAVCAAVDLPGLLAAALGGERKPLLLVGTGIEPALPHFADWPGVDRSGAAPLPDAAFVAALGASAEAPCGPPVPLYLRPPDAALAAAPAWTVAAP